MSTSKVSIIIATWNSQATLAACLNSIFSQSHANVEVIIVDGASSDQTMEIVFRFGSKIAYSISEKDDGIYDAWNKGLGLASGRWITFIGSDDVFTSAQSLEMLVNAGERESSQLVCCRANIVDSSGDIVRVIGEPWDWKKHRSFQRVIHPGLLHDASLFKTFGMFDRTFRICGDYEFLLRLPEKTTAVFLAEPLLNVGGDGVSRTSIKKTLHETYVIQSRAATVGKARASYNLFLATAKARVRNLCAR